MILHMRLWNHFLLIMAVTLQRRNNYHWDSARAIVTMMINVCHIFIASNGTKMKRSQAVEVV
jgi:hypothetical protein